MERTRAAAIHNAVPELPGFTRHPGLLGVLAISALCASETIQASIVSDWNQTALIEVRASNQGPTVASRSLAILHTCIYDAWTAYDSTAAGTALSTEYRRPYFERTARNKAAAISYAAYRCLSNLYPDGVERLRTAMRHRGYDETNTSKDRTTPAGIGNSAAAAVIESRRDDGANQYGTRNDEPYADYTGYAPRNDPLPYCIPAFGSCAVDSIQNPSVWQPLVSDAGAVQRFITPHWENVRPFGYGSPIEFDDGSSARAQSQVRYYFRPAVEISEASATPDPDILRGGKTLQTLADEAVHYSSELTLDRKVLIEYWADGPDSELPAGHWGLLAQFVSARDNHSIDQDVKMFFIMHNAALDAGIVAWHWKRKFDGARPITVVRVVKQGQKIRAWGGPERPIETISGDAWLPYNPGSNLTPSFPGFVSGHAVFSWSSATVLKLFKGSDYFGFSTVVPANFGRVEPDIPPTPTTLSFDTFSDAAESASLSRVYGGIHFNEDIEVGRSIGIITGAKAWNKALQLFNGTRTSASPPPQVSRTYTSYLWYKYRWR